MRCGRFHLLMLLMAAAPGCNSWGNFWLTSANVLPSPTVVSFSPANGSANLALPTALTVTFDMAMDATSLTTTSSGSTCSGSFQVSTDGFASCLAGTLTFPSDRQVSFQPATGFCVDTQYALQFRVTTAARAQNGQGLVAASVASTSFLTQQALLKVNVTAGTSVNALLVSCNTLFVGGAFTQVGGVTRNNIAAINLITGQLNSLGPPSFTLNSSASTFAVDGNNLLVGGVFTNAGGLTRNNIAAFDMTTGAGSGLGSWCTTSPLLPTNAMIATASRLYLGGQYGPGACGINFYNFGAVDTATAASVGFANGAGTGANNTVNALSLSATKLYVGGAFTGAGSFVSTVRNYAGATDLNGAVTSWDPNMDAAVTAIANVGSSVFLGGSFTTVNGGTPASRLTVVDATTGTVRP